MLFLPRPTDAHVHFRQGVALSVTVPATAATFHHAIVEPNTNPPVRTAAEALTYREQILDAEVWVGMDSAVASLEASRVRDVYPTFDPRMTIYLTDETKPRHIGEAVQSGLVAAAKLYPAHATTGSAFGVSDVRALTPVFAAMDELGLPLQVHGEVTDERIDIFDREAVFIERHLRWLVEQFPGLKVCLEHITTEEAVEYIEEVFYSTGGEVRLAGSITAHHLFLNRTDLFVHQGRGGIRPHHYCLPIAKRERHRRAVLRAATSGLACFFLGTDSAPHERMTKESACGCAGIFTAPHALALYATAFWSEGALEALPHFATFANVFYGLPGPGSLPGMQIVSKESVIPDSYLYLDGRVVPFKAGERLPFTYEEGVD